MIDPEDVPPVDADESLARFILQRSYIRNDETIRPNAFIPHPHEHLSVTRHRKATEEEIWTVGQSIAVTREKTLHGRGDLRATVCLRQELRVDAKPVAGNPNHANISNWPADKPAQKIIAQELAAKAAFVPNAAK